MPWYSCRDHIFQSSLCSYAVLAFSRQLEEDVRQKSELQKKLDSCFVWFKTRKLQALNGLQASIDVCSTMAEAFMKTKGKYKKKIQNDDPKDEMFQHAEFAQQLSDYFNQEEMELIEEESRLMREIKIQEETSKDSKEPRDPKNLGFHLGIVQLLQVEVEQRRLHMWKLKTKLPSLVQVDTLENAYTTRAYLQLFLKKTEGYIRGFRYDQSLEWGLYWKPFIHELSARAKRVYFEKEYLISLKTQSLLRDLNHRITFFRPILEDVEKKILLLEQEQMNMMYHNYLFTLSTSKRDYPSDQISLKRIQRTLQRMKEQKEKIGQLHARSGKNAATYLDAPEELLAEVMGVEDLSNHVGNLCISRLEKMKSIFKEHGLDPE